MPDNLLMGGTNVAGKQITRQKIFVHSINEGRQQLVLAKKAESKVGIARCCFNSGKKAAR